MFELSKDHEDFRAVVREFAEAEVAPHIATWDREEIGRASCRERV